ncbi:MAG TPA: SigB/SigF/SigG family RNA polymerase sigma factor [Actinomycetota bacterium]|jgi:RNA polymerase sigma-B factor|nr:SigB/SigF/SigG family RNA polymerase sigma factor [Actinomycetota bacterium]
MSTAKHPARDEHVEDDELFAKLPGDPAARDELVVRNLPLASYLARKFVGRGEALEDLEQVANLALLKAIDRFDATREVRFSTFATVTIVGELKRHLRDRGWSVRVPRQLQEMAVRITRELPELWQELGRSPTIPEIGDRIDATEDDVLEAMDAAQAYAAESLDQPTGDGNLTPGEALGSIDDRLERMEGWATVAPLIEQLPERERRILYLRFFEDKTQSEIAAELGISQMHVSRLLSQVLSFLRDNVDESPR